MHSKILQVDIQKKITLSDGHKMNRYKFELGRNQIIGIQGSSGSGKTSLLKLISGLLKPDSGSIKFAERQWFNSTEKINLTPQDRKAGFVFQDLSLFPTMTLRQNIAYGAEDRKSPLIDEMLQFTGLQSLQHKKPHQVSGGQAQRVAIARAIASKPNLLLLDEPFTALDQFSKKTVINDLIKIFEQFQLPTIIVSHDTADLLNFTSDILILEKGSLNPLPMQKVSQDLSTITGKVISVESHNQIAHVFTGKQLYAVPMAAISESNWNVGAVVSVKLLR